LPSSQQARKTNTGDRETHHALRSAEKPSYLTVSEADRRSAEEMLSRSSDCAALVAVIFEPFCLILCLQTRDEKMIQLQPIMMMMMMMILLLLIIIINRKMLIVLSIIMAKVIARFYQFI